MIRLSTLATAFSSPCAHHADPSAGGVQRWLLQRPGCRGQLAGGASPGPAELTAGQACFPPMEDATTALRPAAEIAAEAGWRYRNDGGDKVARAYRLRRGDGRIHRFSDPDYADGPAGTRTIR